MKDGPYIFRFAENATYEAFYYSKEKRNKISHRLCHAEKYVTETYTDTITITNSNLSKEFLDCLNFISTYETFLQYSLKRYVKCRIIKSINCGRITVHHTDYNDVKCDLGDWNKTSSAFVINVKNYKQVSTLTSISNLSLGPSDLIGYLRCTVPNGYFSKYHIEEPFILRKPQTTTGNTTPINETTTNEDPFILRKPQTTTENTTPINETTTNEDPFILWKRNAKPINAAPTSTKATSPMIVIVCLVVIIVMIPVVLYYIKKRNWQKTQSKM